jgi:hypothetical protein
VEEEVEVAGVVIASYKKPQTQFSSQVLVKALLKRICLHILAV